MLPWLGKQDSGLQHAVAFQMCDNAVHVPMMVSSSCCPPSLRTEHHARPRSVLRSGTEHSMGSVPWHDNTSCSFLLL